MKHQPITKNINTVNDCTESKCINCVNSHGCIYKRSAYEIPQEQAFTEQSNRNSSVINFISYTLGFLPVQTS
jgi:hypothetical protein